jgi:hypothetical protein
MDKIRRVTANMPEILLKEAMDASGLSLTETLIQGLRLVARSAAFKKAQKLKGHLDLSVDLEVSRERTGR